MNAPSSLLPDLLNDLKNRYQPLTEGQVADYIPELARVDPGLFAISVMCVSGELHGAGDTDHRFTLQSVSKPFLFGLALEEHGREKVFARVGVEPSGDAFNSIIQLEMKSKRPHNPMINAGAIAVTDLVAGTDPSDRLKKVLWALGRYMGRTPAVDMSVFVSERSTGHRNRAIAHLLRAFGMMGPDIEASLELYFQQCAVQADCRELATMAATLANGGLNPVTGERALPAEYVQDVLSVMFTSGMYDSSGEWAYTVGVPAKSGVSGAILMVRPGRLGAAVYSPRLDEHGHSVRGLKVCRELSERLGLSLFQARNLGGGAS